MPFLLLCLLLDLTLVVLDFFQEPRFEIREDGVPILAHHMLDHFFYIMSGLSIAGMAVSIFSIGCIFKMVSFAGIITLLTFGYQIVLFGIQVSGAYTVEYFYVPFFLRVWTLRRYFLTFMSVLVGASDSARLTLSYHVMPPMTMFIGTMFSAASIFQFIDTASAHREEPLSLVQALYFIVVTFSTVGYGDITPTTFYSRLAVIFFICIALVQVPQFLSTVDIVKGALPKLREYTGEGMHIVVNGVDTIKEMRVLLDELSVVAARARLVFVINGDISKDCMKLSWDPRYRQRAVIISGDLHDETVMARVRVRDARAVLLLSNKASVSERGDSNVLFTSIAISQHDPAVPQYHWLRFGTHAFLTPHAYCISRDRFTSAILSLGAMLPGIIPFLCNLVKSPSIEDKGMSIPQIVRSVLKRRRRDTGCSWGQLYEDSRLCQLHLMPLPLALAGRTFRDGVVIVSASSGVTLVGVVRNDVMIVNPSADIPDAHQHTCANQAHKVFKGAREREFVFRDSDQVLLIGPPHCGLYVGEEDLKKYDDSRRGSDLREAHASMDREIAREDALHVSEASGDEESFLLVDVPSQGVSCDFTDNEMAVNEQLMVRKLILMVQTIKAVHRRCKVKLLSPTPPSEYMLHAWAKSGFQTVTHVLGSALDGEDVYQALEDDRVPGYRQAGVGPYRTKGIVIFSTCYSGRSNDALLFAAHTTIKRLLTENDTCSHATNLVIQLTNLAAATTIGPFHIDEATNRKVENDYYLAPPFMMGKVFSSDMLQTILIHSCVTPHIVPFIERLTNVPKDLWQSAKLGDYDERISERIAMTRFRVYANCNTGNAHQGRYYDTFIDALTDFMHRHGLLCVGIFRVLPVSSGAARFMITNPPPWLVLQDNDEFYCIAKWDKNIRKPKQKR